MGNIRARKENGKLLLDFHFHGVRFREQTALPDNQQNRKKVQALLDRVEARIKLGEFNYSEFFPGSKNIQKFLEVDPSQAGENQIQSLRVQPASVATKIAAKAPLFESFARQWQAEKKIEWRASHARNIESVLSNSLIKFFGKRVLSDITKAEILEFRSKLASKPGRGGKEQIAAKTINTHMALLKAILEEASDRYSFENPYKNIKPLKLQRSHVEPFSLIEVNRIIESVREDYRNYYSVRFYSGMRTGEIDGLRWEFVDFKRGLIAIRETLVQGKTEYTKTDGSQRDIPMLGPVKAAL
jgi:integrase